MSIGISSSTQESNPAQAISLRYAFAGFTDIPRAGFRSLLAAGEPTAFSIEKLERYSFSDSLRCTHNGSDAHTYARKTV
jgi:hypothetical protein